MMRYRLTHLLLTFATFLLLGCAQNVTLDKPATPLNSQNIALGEAITNAKKITWPETNWWHIYGDAQLNHLLAEAIQDSDLMHSIHHRINLAQHIADQYQANRGADIELSATNYRERFTALQFIPPPWAGHTYWNNSVFSSLSFDLDLWGQRKNQWLASLDQAQAIALDGQEVRIELEHAIIQLYIKLATQYELQDIARQEMSELEQRIDIEIQRNKVGLGSDADLNQQETMLPILKTQVESYGEQIELIKNEIAALSGHGPGASHIIERPHLTLNTPIGVPDNLPLHLISKKPEIAAAQLRIASMQKNIEVAKSAYYPDINLSSFIGVTAIGFNQLFSQAAMMSGVGPAISLPLFDNGRRQASLGAASSNYDLAVDEYNIVIINSLKDVANALTKLNSSVKQKDDLILAVKKASQSVHFAEESYTAGINNYLQVLEANQRHLLLQEKLIGIESERLIAYADLMLSLGGGM